MRAPAAFAAILALTLVVGGPSRALAEPAALPNRILRLGYAEGTVEYRPAAVSNVATPSGKTAGARAGATSLPASPLIPGDVLTTGADGRAELSLGTAAIRLDTDTRLTVDALDESAVRLRLERGSANVMVRELADDETLAILTPRTTVTLHEPGEYRVDIADDGETNVSVRHGVTPQQADAFDDWVLDREVQLAEAAPPVQYDAAGDVDYAALDDYGEWVDEPQYGRVWMPSYAYGGYDPFSYGHWQSTSFGGWSWYDPMPWGYYTGFGYGGRWTYLNDRNRWCWVPPRRGHGSGHGRNDRPSRQVAQGTYTAPYGPSRGNDPRRVNNPLAIPEPAEPPSPTLPRAFEGTRTTPAVRASGGGSVAAKPTPRTTPTRVTPTRVTPTRTTPTPAPAPRTAPARSSESASSQAVSSASKKGMAPRQDP